jgi:AraC-like DNA-binding protein
VNLYFHNPQLDAEFSLLIGTQEITQYFHRSDYLLMLWNNGTSYINMQVDDQSVNLLEGQLTFLTYKQKIRLSDSSASLIALVFNRAFYCIHTNDSEVSCNGLLFFGSNYTPKVSLDEDEKVRLQTLIGVLQEEFEQRDANQEEMLRLLLKRFIIRCTRMARVQLTYEEAGQHDIDIIRQYNFLVEEHFREKRKVSDYADLLFKSPKTIANIFNKYENKSPLKIIHDRIILEAKRMLFYTDRSVKEISMDLGFEEPTQFNKFFKKNTTFTPLDFKKQGTEMNKGKN